MIKMLLALEKKGVQRGVKQKGALAIKILQIIAIVYFSFIFLVLGAVAFDTVQELYPQQNVYYSVSIFLVYYFIFEFVFRVYWQKIPTGNLKHLLLQPISKSTIVKYFMGKSFISYINFIQLLFYIPFIAVGIKSGMPVLGVLSWSISMYLVSFSLHFLTILISSDAKIANILIALGALIGGLHYYEVFDFTQFTRIIFFAPFENPIWAVAYLSMSVGLVAMVYRFYKKNMYLDYLEPIKVNVGETRDLLFLDKFGKYALFLKNDIKLLIRNKRGKSTLVMSVVFLFYGFLLLSNEDSPTYLTYAKYLLVGFMTGGGFMLMYGQFVPAWDSSYFKLYSTSNFNFKEYLQSKWILIVVGTIILTLCCSLYLYFSLELYLAILAVSVFNIGITGYAMLWAGLYNNTPIDLTVNRNIFGEKKAFNLTILLISLPTMLMPQILFAIGYFAHSFYLGLILVALAGIIGICFHGRILSMISRFYNKNKYETLDAFNKI